MRIASAFDSARHMRDHFRRSKESQTAAVLEQSRSLVLGAVETDLSSFDRYYHSSIIAIIKSTTHSPSPADSHLRVEDVYISLLSPLVSPKAMMQDRRFDDVTSRRMPFTIDPVVTLLINFRHFRQIALTYFTCSFLYSSSRFHPDTSLVIMTAPVFGQNTEEKVFCFLCLSGKEATINGFIGNDQCLAVQAAGLRKELTQKQCAAAQLLADAISNPCGCRPDLPSLGKLSKKFAWNNLCRTCY
jgi:hypothetical protein